VLRALVLAGALAALPCAAAAAPDAPASAAPGTSIPFKKPGAEPASDWSRALAALVAVAALGWAGLYALRRLRLVPPVLRGAARRIRLLETSRLDARVTLYLVASDGRAFLLGRCGDSLVVLRDFEAPAQPGERA
jgi:flagellar biogenesis protein FliO